MTGKNTQLTKRFAKQLENDPKRGKHHFKRDKMRNRRNILFSQESYHRHILGHKMCLRENTTAPFSSFKSHSMSVSTTKIISARLSSKRFWLVSTRVYWRGLHNGSYCNLLQGIDSPCVTYCIDSQQPDLLVGTAELSSRSKVMPALILNSCFMYVGFMRISGPKK